MRFDLLLKGGYVMDRPAGYDGILDIAVRHGRIASVERDIPVSTAAKVLDVSGEYISAGLIDLHTHVFRGVGYFGIDADAIAPTTGVTTWVDAGSAGAFTFPGFRESVIRQSTVRILAFINISYLGLVGLNYDEYCNIDSCDVDLVQRVLIENQDLICGVKTRMGTARVGNQGLTPLRLGLEAAARCELPVMVHISNAPPDVTEILSILRPGDIVTHSFTGLSQKLIGGDGAVLSAAQSARDRGVLFDVGHGGGSFSFISAEALAAAGFWPDVISSDLHQVSIFGPNLVDPQAQELIARVKGDGTPTFTLLSVMDKFLYLGMPLADVIEATTCRPASILEVSDWLGTIKPGAMADLNCFVVEKGAFDLADIHGNVRRSDRHLVNRRTIVAGRVMSHAARMPTAPWVRLVDHD